MTALRITQPTIPKPTHLRVRLGVLLAAFAMFGCGTAPPPTDDPHPPATISPGTNDPTWLTSRGQLPAPDTDRVEYNPRERLLCFHPLPAGDRWMVQLPDEERARFVGPLHQLPEGVDTSRTLVYFARPGAPVSAPVTVAQIEAGRAPHTSLTRNP
jgi:hypothetical protein